MDVIYTLGDDLGDLMKSFLQWKEKFMETTKVCCEMNGMVEVMREELKMVRESDKNERHRDSSNCEVLIKQQSLIEELMCVKDENLKMSSQIMDLEKSLNDLKSVIANERNDHIQKLENVNISHTFEMNQLKMKAEYDVNSMKIELEEKCSEFHQRYKEIAKKLQALECEKDEEIKLVIAEYEEKLHNCNEELTMAKLENKYLQDNATSNYEQKHTYMKKDDMDHTLKVLHNKLHTANNQRTLKNLCTTLKPSKNDSNKHKYNCDTDSKGRFWNIPNENNHGNDLSLSFTKKEQKLLEVPQEKSENFPVSIGRNSVSFPVSKKKKLFTPTQQNSLS